MHLKLYIIHSIVECRNFIFKDIKLSTCFIIMNDVCTKCFTINKDRDKQNFVVTDDTFIDIDRCL